MPIFELIRRHGEYQCGGEKCSVETHEHQLSQALCQDLPSLTLDNPQMPPFQSPWRSRVYWWIVMTCIAKCAYPNQIKSIVERNNSQTCTIIKIPILNYPHLTFDTNNSYIPRNLPLYPGVIANMSIIWFLIQIHGCICLLIELCGHVETWLPWCDGTEVCGCGD